MRQIFTLIIAVLATIVAGHAAVYTPAQVPDVHRADRRDFVANPDGILSPRAVAYIDSTLQALRQSTSVEAMVVAVDDITDPDDASDFATELFTLWGLGKSDKDNGLLILLVKDAHKVQIRTGYGLEGALPDIACARIIREVMTPAFRQDNYDAGICGAVAMIDRILTDPQYGDEFRSSQADTDTAAGDDSDDMFSFYLFLCSLLAVFMLGAFLLTLLGMRHADSQTKYRRFIGWKPYYLVGTFGGLGLPLIASLPLLLCLYHWRNHTRKCPNCGTRMRKVDEVHDNEYLTPSQDLEERIGSVDYDVWLCPACGETDILPYTSTASPYVECERCHARTARLVRNRIVTPPTRSRQGQGVKEYHCLNCNHDQHNYYTIDRKTDDAMAAAAAAAALGSMSRGSRGGGGGFSSGSGSFGGGFGGGDTGGGGAGGSW